MVKEKLTIQEMAKEIGVKEENLNAGLKGNTKKGVEEGIRKAYEFKMKGGKK